MSELKDIEILEKVKAILNDTFTSIEDENDEEFADSISSARELMNRFKSNEITEEKSGEVEDEDISLVNDCLVLLDASLGSDDWDTINEYVNTMIEIIDELIDNEEGEEEEGEEEEGEEEEGEEEEGEEEEGEEEEDDNEV